MKVLKITSSFPIYDRNFWNNCTSAAWIQASHPEVIYLFGTVATKERTVMKMPTFWHDCMWVYPVTKVFWNYLGVENREKKVSLDDRKASECLFSTATTLKVGKSRNTLLSTAVPKDLGNRTTSLNTRVLIGCVTSE